MKNFIQNWLFKKELSDLKDQSDRFTTLISQAEVRLQEVKSLKTTFEKVLQNIDVSVDVHEFHQHSRSWAVVSLQGQRSDYIKFIDLGDRDLRDIAEFLHRYERSCHIKIDATPMATDFLRVEEHIKRR